MTDYFKRLSKQFPTLQDDEALHLASQAAIAEALCDIVGELRKQGDILSGIYNRLGENTEAINVVAETIESK